MLLKFSVSVKLYLLITILFCCSVFSQSNRPPEMVAAGRDFSPYPVLVDFEDIDGWRLDTTGGIDADLCLTDRTIVYGKSSAEISINNAQKGNIKLIPPQPVNLSDDFDTINIWARYLPYRYTLGPWITFYAILQDANGQDFKVDLKCGYFGIWELLNTRIISVEGERFNYNPAKRMVKPVKFKAIEIDFDPASMDPPFTINLDTLCVFKEELNDIEFNHKLQQLPSPTTDDTILPLSKGDVKLETASVDGSYRFSCNDGASKTVYDISVSEGNFNDIVVEHNGESFQPCRDGGVVFNIQGEQILPNNPLLQVENNSAVLQDGVLDTQWLVQYKEYTSRYSIIYQVKNKSLIIDTKTFNNDGVEVLFGNISLPNAKTVAVPYLRYEGISPKIVSYKDIFVSGLVDWWNSDSTHPFALEGATSDGKGVYYNGGVRYLPLSNGDYNNIRERFFITVSTDFQEVLPNIPNPKSKYLEQYNKSSWRWLYGGPRRIDWVRQLHEYGVENFMVRFHADGMRDTEESYCLRDTAADSIGNDFFRKIGEEIKQMGYGFAVYSCYIHMEAVNENFDMDILNRDSYGDTTAKFLLYRVKPLAFLDIHSWMAPKIHDTLGTNFSYLDVHAARAPWRDTDCDYRSPMAGMFRLDFLSNAQIMLNDKQAHQGPCWSEGGMQHLYAGFADAVYGYLGHETKWDESTDIVDFAQLQINPRMISIGMGDLAMYYKQTPYKEQNDRFNPYLDRFIAATVAYGHAAWQVHPAYYGIAGAMKSYFLTNAVQRRYIGSDAEEIGYYDGKDIIDTSKAIQSDAYKLKQIYVQYANGLQVWSNLNLDGREWKITVDNLDFVIPSGGFVAFKEGEILAYSAKLNSWHRHEYVKSPEYIYLDGRDKPIDIHGIKLDKGSIAIKGVDEKQCIIRALPNFGGMSVSGQLLSSIGFESDSDSLFAGYESKEIHTTDEVKFNKDGWLNISSEPVVPKIRLLSGDYSKRVQESSGWNVRMFTLGDVGYVSVSNGKIYADFEQKVAWTVKNFKYEGKEVLAGLGGMFNGSVVNLKTEDMWVGTGHGGETVKDFIVEIDDKPYDFVSGENYTGKEIRVVKKSLLGPLAMEATVIFPESGDGMIERNKFTAIENLDNFNYVYAFMHGFENSLDRALYLDGKHSWSMLSINNDDNSFVLNDIIKAASFYSRKNDLMVVYEYPEVYKVQNNMKNSIWDRYNNNKLYFKVDDAVKQLSTNESVEFEAKLTPRSVKASNWRNTTLQIIENGN